jgi:hypothetical protein
MSGEQDHGVATRGVVRQGDVLLMPVDAIPGESRRATSEGTRLVLAEGEATGHAHVVLGGGRLYLPGVERGASGTYLFVEEPATLVHDEHDAIGLEPGAYEVRRQREYVPPAPRRRETFRWVAD